MTIGWRSKIGKAWLRSGNSNNSNNACIVTSAGGFNNNNVNNSNALRPALHHVLWVNGANLSTNPHPTTAHFY
jgi:hypothetical protein